MMEILTLILAAAAAVLGVVNLLKKPRMQGVEEMERRLKEEMRAGRQEGNASVAEALRSASAAQNEAQRRVAEAQDARLRDLTEQLAKSQAMLQRVVSDQSMRNEQKLENIRNVMEKNIAALQAGNEKKLDEMRQTVDEKLQKTLDDRLKQSFSLVNERLEQVYKGLGEMQTLATGVGDLKKVLSNVKTRGILGEIQLGAILEEILAPEQYAVNTATVKGSSERVEYAVRLPGADSSEDVVWLPIDAKFPADAYANLLEAYDSGDAVQVEATGKVLENRIRAFAKDIHEKYIHVPETTEFGIMFLPVEGLYAEVVRRGMVEKLQSEFKVNIAGPTTMAALLNSLQMGFKTLAIQKRSSEVWKVLNDVRSEFATFEKVLTQAQRRLNQASNDLEKLVGVRTRQIQRKLLGVTSLTPGAEELEEEEEDTAALPEEGESEE
ncbi:MAG: DNA recombination protein RmuC [Oscillospiraceae bacterium]